MKKHIKNDAPQKKGATEKVKSQTENAQLTAKRAAKSIDTANRDAAPDDKKSGM